MMDMQGLADYSRNSGYVQGDVTLKNETVKCNFDRGRMFWVDSMDDLETAGIAFGRLAAEFIRTKVGPEIDAFRFATYCSKTGIGKKEETLADGAAVVAALRAATTAMDEDEVSERPVPVHHAYAVRHDLGPGHHQEPRDPDRLRKNRQGAAEAVPYGHRPALRRHRRGSWRLQEGGRCVRPELVIVHKPAVIQYHKHAAPKIVTPDANQDGDAYKYGYRLVSIADLYANKLAGVYASYKPVAGG